MRRRRQPRERGGRDLRRPWADRVARRHMPPSTAAERVPQLQIRSPTRSGPFSQIRREKCVAGILRAAEPVSRHPRTTCAIPEPLLHPSPVRAARVYGIHRGPGPFVMTVTIEACRRPPANGMRSQRKRDYRPQGSRPGIAPSPPRLMRACRAVAPVCRRYSFFRVGTPKLCTFAQ